MTTTTREIYVGFDPGHTTGVAVAEYIAEENKLIVTSLTPIEINTRYKQINIEAPPIPCFGDFHDKAETIYEDIMREIFDGTNPGIIHTAIEDFTGGTGGNIQNTVNKLIGILMAVVFGSVVPPDFGTEPKVFRNSSRKRYLPQVFEVTEPWGSISKHSKDAFAHLLHRVYQEHSDKFETMTIERGF